MSLQRPPRRFNERWRLSRADEGQTRHPSCGRRPNANCLADGGNYRARRESVHRNDEPKQNPSLSTQPLYFIAGLSESL